jgi:hypothetical protein
MKKMAVIACMVTSMSLHAQYFQHIYGTPFNEENQWGMNTVQMGTGFLISGIGSIVATNSTRIEISRTDITGNVPALPYFNKTYRLRSSTNVALNVTDAKAIEINSTSIGVAGTWYDPAITSDRYIYYCVLDASGNPLATTYYKNPHDRFFTLTSIKMAPSGTRIYLTGLAHDNNTGENRIYVLKIRLNGTLDWSHTYDRDLTVIDDDRAYDVMEDPNSGEVIVVGTVANNFQTDAFYLRLNATTGAAIGIDTYGTTSTYDQFSAVDYSNDVNNNLGQVIGGYTDATPGGDYDVWVMRLDDNFNPNFNNIYDYNNTKVINICRDVIERQNTSGNYEYYAGGITNTGLLGSSDIEVDKITSNGSLVVQFSYGNSSSQSISTLDQNNSGVADGLSIFGLTRYTSPNFSNNEQYIIKTYFNGVTACRYTADTIIPQNGPGYITSPPIDTVDRFATFSGSMNVNVYADSTICFSKEVNQGDNRSLATGTSPQVQLQSVTGISNGIVLTITHAQEGNATITVSDLLGNALYINQTPLIEGDNRISLSLPPGCSSGMYLVTIVQAGKRDSTSALANLPLLMIETNPLQIYGGDLCCLVN